MVSRSAATLNRLVRGSIPGGGFFFAYVHFFFDKKNSYREWDGEVNGKWNAE